MITKECLKCDTTFKTRQVDINRGHGKFCSISCANNYNRVRPKKPNVTCSLCGKQFYKRPSNLSGSKSGLFFCCRKHKDLAQRIGGIEEIQPTHYGTGYRALARRKLPQKCNHCGLDKHPEILHVHHKDRDRSNNKIENLEVLCPNCHALEHRRK